MQVIRQFQDHGLQFQILQVFRQDTRKAQPGSQQISRYCPCRVAVTAMVHRGDQKSFSYFKAQQTAMAKVSSANQSEQRVCTGMIVLG